MGVAEAVSVGVAEAFSVAMAVSVGMAKLPSMAKFTSGRKVEVFSVGVAEVLCGRG